MKNPRRTPLISEHPQALVPPLVEDHKTQLTWPHAIKGRRPFQVLTLRLGEGCHNQELILTPDIITISGQVGIDHFELKLDRFYANDVKQARKAEMRVVCDLFVEQVKKSTDGIEPIFDATLSNPFTQFDSWSTAIKNRGPFVWCEMKLGESPNSQRVPTPDVVHLNGKIGGHSFTITLDRLYEDELKSKLKAQMLAIVALFVEKITSSIENL